MAGVLWLMWLYLSGRWRPRSASERRRALLRFRLAPRAVTGWALLAGGLSLVALVFTALATLALRQLHRATRTSHATLIRGAGGGLAAS